MPDEPDMNDTMQKIETTIRTLCAENRPFTTVSDIAEQSGFSERTVLNNADGVVRRKDDIVKEKVGKANVYYVKPSLFDEIETEATVAISRLMFLKTKAEYVELREAPSDSEFDLEAYWYDTSGRLLEEYLPNSKEIGEAAHMHAEDPVKIKYHDRISADELEDEQ
jgi:hypothetical protein